MFFSFFLGETIAKFRKKNKIREKNSPYLDFDFSVVTL